MATLNISEQELDALQTKVANDQISVTDAWAFLGNKIDQRGQRHLAF